MFLNASTLLVLTIILFGGLTVLLAALLLTLRREHSRRLQLSAREELLTREIAALEATCDRLRDERTELYAENRDLSSRFAALQTTVAEAGKQSADHRALLEKTREQMEKEFELLAGRILSEKGAALTNRHQDELNTILAPVRQQIAEFRMKVEDVYDRESRDRVSLIKEIEHLKLLNLRISEDAINLTNALKGQNKMQGLWGELVLERLLEDSGLTRGREFDLQVCLKDNRGKSRLPDAVVRLPGGRQIVIDAKVSLTAYEKACRAGEEDERQGCLRGHLDSLKKHIAGLAAREYHLLDGVNAPDFVVLFLPAEGAFQAAVTMEPALLTRAMEQKVILSCPSTLLAILRTINHMWRQDEQARNSLAIAKQAGSLYDKFIGFIEAFEEIGARLHQSHEAWNRARNRLTTGKGNLITRAEALRELGVQSSKNLPRSICSEEEGRCPGATKKGTDGTAN
ncbi:MAG TPA: DNA recombination protein RmuC [Desulfobacteraceae bacterium]|nr:DNA recombination protein RmuC [Desulfobacteraceae bacterium]